MSRLFSTGIDLQGNKIEGVDTPTVSTDGANKQYVDDAISGGTSFESISKNIKSWNTTINYSNGDIDSIVYTDGTSTITKTFNYTSGDLTSLLLSGDTPSGIDLTKTFNYTSGDITGWSYS